MGFDDGGGITFGQGGAGYPGDENPYPTKNQSGGNSKKPKITTDDIIFARIEAGQTFMRPHISRALRAGNRYLDSSMRTLQTNRNIDGETRDLPVGEVNYMARHTWPLAA